jgi:hypothetical protein
LSGSLQAKALTLIQRNILEIMLGALDENTNDTVNLLTAFTKYYNNAEALIFSGVVWKQLSKQVVFFHIQKRIETV